MHFVKTSSAGPSGDPNRASGIGGGQLFSKKIKQDLIYQLKARLHKVVPIESHTLVFSPFPYTYLTKNIRKKDEFLSFL